MRIGRLACSALTTYHWDTLRDSSTEQRYTHIAHDSQPPTKKRWQETATNMKKLHGRNPFALRHQILHSPMFSGSNKEVAHSIH